MSDREETYIYESPDGGHTVYRRMIGQTPSEKEIHSISEHKRKWDQQVEREMRWAKIVKEADHDPVLRDMLDRVEIYHRLKSQP